MPERVVKAWMGGLREYTVPGGTHRRKGERSRADWPGKEVPMSGRPGASGNEGLCVRCQTPLQRVRCYACGGDGEVRRALLFRRTCSACGGKGYRSRCPNQLRHLKHDMERLFGSRSRTDVRPAGPAAPRLSARTLTALRNGRTPPPGTFRLQVPPWNAAYPHPWHPNHPRNPYRRQNLAPWDPAYPYPWHPMHPNNPFKRQNLPPWDARYPHPWHPSHPRHPKHWK